MLRSLLQPRRSAHRKFFRKPSRAITADVNVRPYAVRNDVNENEEDEEEEEEKEIVEKRERERKRKRKEEKEERKERGREREKKGKKERKKGDRRKGTEKNDLVYVKARRVFRLFDARGRPSLRNYATHVRSRRIVGAVPTPKVAVRFWTWRKTRR